MKSAKGLPRFLTSILLLSLLVSAYFNSYSNRRSTTENAPGVEAKALYNEDFKWTITIPENFSEVSAHESAELMNEGIEMIENTYGVEMENESIADRTKTIFDYQNTDLNSLEANYQPFDPAVDGDYLEHCRATNEILYNVCKLQIPNTSVDSTSSVETISGLEFQTLRIEVVASNGITMQLLMYSRLFGTKELTVNIMYVNEPQGEKMLDAWRNSKFE